MKRYRLDRRRDSVDHKDPIYEMGKCSLKGIATLIDLRPNCPPIEDQGQLGSCTAHAMAGALEYLELQDFRAHQTMQPQEYAGNGLQRVSRLFIYYNERLIEGDVSVDGGAELRDGVLALSRYGVPNEDIWPYDPTDIYIKPLKAAYAQAIKHKISSYSRIINPQQMKNCLDNGYPFVAGIYVYRSFMEATDGNIPMPTNHDELLGGHAVLIVGYDDFKQHFIFRNSWGVSFGNQGYGYLPYDYVQNPNLCDDLWTIRK